MITFGVLSAGWARADQAEPVPRAPSTKEEQFAAAVALAMGEESDPAAEKARAKAALDSEIAFHRSTILHLQHEKMVLRRVLKKDAALKPNVDRRLAQIEQQLFVSGERLKTLVPATASTK